MSRNQINSGNHEKAWNDPPQLQFSSSKTSAKPSNRLRDMKKRIPVPMNNERPVTVNSGNARSMPPSMSAPPLEQNSKFQTIEKTVESESLSNVSLELIETYFNELLAKFPAESFEETKKEDLIKRLELMKCLWKENNLHDQVKIKLHKIMDALKKNENDLAWSMHQEIVVDYTKDCAPWILAIKTMISMSRKGF